MGEELIQRNLNKNGISITKYEYYNLGATTLKQLKTKKIICSQDYGLYETRKPDALLVNRQNKELIDVVVVVEYKRPSEFKTKNQQIKATQQCNDLCQVLGSKIGVITDGQIAIWINPKENIKENEYLDRTSNEKRSYNIIQNEDKKDISELFEIQTKPESEFGKLDENTQNTIYLIKRICNAISPTNSRLIPTEEVDPLPLATNVWQDIYINTGKDPTKCLYNVVELFIFKFLSDLNVLKSPYNIESLLGMYKNGNDNKEVLRHYARNSRPEIIKLFPKAEDGTTIINGTIFVDSKGNPVESQAHLFRSSLEKYSSFGSLKNIKKEFKTKLFETFLKQSQDKSKLGQFFTPRKVVKAIVDMADVESLPDGSRVCDPFCGVGGFLLETIQKPKRKKDFSPRNGKISPKISYTGFDKGSDEDEKRTIILAKANMLIYLSEIVENNPSLTKEFSRIFNQTFNLLTESNLGTLGIVIEEEEEKYDLILTNPPYISSGVKSIKNEIKADGLEEFYTTNGKGVEGLSLEWIIRNLKKNGKAFIIVPDSIFGVSQNETLRKFILDNCYINCIISLPTKTFFNTPKKTYILGITKKEDKKEIQTFPVFTYLVNNIGESLNTNRFETEGKSDLEKSKELFNSYKGSPDNFPVNEIGDLRCKLQPIEKFNPKDFWNVDRWWNLEEKIEIGVEEEEQIIGISEFTEKLEDFSKKIKEYVKILEEI